MIAVSNAYKTAMDATVRPPYLVKITFTLNGDEVILTNEDIYNAVLTRENNPISSILPSILFEFEIENKWGIITGDLIERSELLFEFGVELETIESDIPVYTEEWVMGATLVLTGEFTVSNNNVRFKAVDKLNYLTQMIAAYDFLPGQSVYQIIEWLLTTNGITDYEIDAELEDIYMTTALKKDTVRNVLQTLCNANRCVIKVDALGKIIVVRNGSYGSIQDYDITFNEVLNNYPILSKRPLLNTLKVKTYKYASDNRKIIFDTTFNHTGEMLTTYAFDAATNVLLNTDATLIESTIYTDSVDVRMICHGDSIFQISGTPFLPTVEVIELSNNNSGETIEHDNYLLDNDTATTASWIKTWYDKRNEYTLEYRGALELEPLDIIGLETKESGSINTIVLKNEIDIVNSTGKLTVREV